MYLRGKKSGSNQKIDQYDFSEVIPRNINIHKNDQNEEPVNEEEINQFQSYLSNINYWLISEDKKWYNSSIVKLYNFTVNISPIHKQILITSEAFLNFYTIYSDLNECEPIFIKSITNLVLNSPEISELLIKNHFLPILQNYLVSSDNNISLLAIKTLNNLASTSFFSICTLFGVNIFSCFRIIFSQNLAIIPTIARIIGYLFQQINLPSNKKIITQEEISLLQSDSLPEIDFDLIIPILDQNFVLDNLTDYWYCLVFCASYSDSKTKMYSLTILKDLCQYEGNPQFIVRNTKIFEFGPQFLQRENTDLTIIYFNLLCELAFHIDSEMISSISQENSEILFDCLKEGCFSQIPEIRASAIQAFSNFYCYNPIENANIFTSEFLDQFLTCFIQEDYQTKKWVSWLIANILRTAPSILEEPMKERIIMETILDFIQADSGEVACLLISGLLNLFRYGESIQFDYKALFRMCNGMDVLDNLIDLCDDIVYDTAVATKTFLNK